MPTRTMVQEAEAPLVKVGDSKDAVLLPKGRLYKIVMRKDV